MPTLLSEMTDAVEVGRCRRMAASLGMSPDLVQPDRPIPRYWHWIFFAPLTATSDLNPDGHPPRDAGLPPVEDYPRRMFGGSEVEIRGDLIAGRSIELRQSVAAVESRVGASGHFQLVHLDRQIAQAGTIVIAERQRLIYRADGRGDSAQKPRRPAPDTDDPSGRLIWQDDAMGVDAAMLFRLSAVMFNAHRIHYDRDWAVEREGYPGLVVHGPLPVLMIIERLSDQIPDIWYRIGSVRYRPYAALFDTAPFAGRAWLTDDMPEAQLTVRAMTGDGARACEATIRLNPRVAF